MTIRASVTSVELAGSVAPSPRRIHVGAGLCLCRNVRRRGCHKGGDLKDLGDALDAGEASLVVISTTEFDRELTDALKAVNHQVKKLEKADAKEFERELKSISGS
jgi:hypothetical protein